MNIGYVYCQHAIVVPQKYGGQPKGVKPITIGRSMIKENISN